MFPAFQRVCCRGWYARRCPRLRLAGVVPPTFSRPLNMSPLCRGAASSSLSWVGVRSSPFALDLRRFLLFSGLDSPPDSLVLPRLASTLVCALRRMRSARGSLVTLAAFSRAPARVPIYWMCVVPFCQKQQPLMPYLRVMFSRLVLHMSVMSRY